MKKFLANSFQAIAGLAVVGALVIAAAHSSELAARPAQGTSTPANAQTAPSGNAENGKDLYVKLACYSCHNYDASGAGTGPRLAPSPLPWALFNRAIRTPSSAMPPYTTKTLSEAQLADIYAYMKTFPPPPSLASIPLLQQ